MRIQREQPILRRFNFRYSHRFNSKQYLPLKITIINYIKINNTQRSNTRRREVQQYRTSQPT
jgi:hypothetical protein